MRIISGVIINGKDHDSYVIIKSIENLINNMLEQLDNQIESIQINSSLHYTDYDALTLRVVFNCNDHNQLCKSIGDDLSTGLKTGGTQCQCEMHDKVYYGCQCGVSGEVKPQTY